MESVTHVVLTVRLPDRPGALGAVASRIGAVKANISDVIVASRSDREQNSVDGDGKNGVRTACDTFHLDLPMHVGDIDVMDLLLDELGHVDGVIVETWYRSENRACCE